MNKKLAHTLGYIATGLVLFFIGMYVGKPKDKEAVAKLVKAGSTITGTSTDPKAIA